MQIFVKTLTGKTVTLQVGDWAQVMDIKAKIQEKEGIPIHRQTLYNGNKVLDQDQNSLSSYNVSNEATLQMILHRSVLCRQRPDNEVEKLNEVEESETAKWGIAKRLTNSQNNKNSFTKKKVTYETYINSPTKKKDACENRDENGKYSLTTKEACENFQDRLVESMTLDMNKEVEEKTVAFKKLEEGRIEIILKISELEYKKDRNEKELNKRNQIKNQSHSCLLLDKHEAVKEKRVNDKKILELQKKSENLEFVIRDKETKMVNILREQEEDTNQTAKENKKLEQEISTLNRKRVSIERKENDLLKKKKVNDGLVEFISNTIEEKMKDLECPVCFETAEVPIFRCERDHLICNKCLPKLTICSECRKPYSESPIRNRYAEKQVEEIKKLSAKREAILDGV